LNSLVVGVQERLGQRKSRPVAGLVDPHVLWLCIGILSHMWRLWGRSEFSIRELLFNKTISTPYQVFSRRLQRKSIDLRHAPQPWKLQLGPWWSDDVGLPCNDSYLWTYRKSLMAVGKWDHGRGNGLRIYSTLNSPSRRDIEQRTARDPVMEVSPRKCKISWHWHPNTHTSNHASTNLHILAASYTPSPF